MVELRERVKGRPVEIIFGSLSRLKEDFLMSFFIVIKVTIVGKVMSLLFNMLSMLAMTFLPRSKHLFISWLQSPSAVILEPRKINQPLFPLFCHLFPISLSIEVMGPDAMILVFSFEL